MLILWDIDGTLLDTGGAGPRAFLAAAAEVFGAEIPPLDFGGATDSGLLRQIADKLERGPLTPCEFDRFMALYLEQMERNLAGGDFSARIFSGARSLLEQLGTLPGVHQSLLTGNTREGARAKLGHFELWERLHHPSGAFGDDHHDRNELGLIALQRAEQHRQRRFAPTEILIIGDTLRDIECAAAIGARCLAVATGWTPLDELRGAGAWRTVESLDRITADGLIEEFAHFDSSPQNGGVFNRG